MKITIKNKKNVCEEQKIPNLPPIDNKKKAEIIRIFSSYRDSTNPNGLISALQSADIDPKLAIYYLNKNIMASDAYISAVESHNNIVRKFGGKEIQVDAFPRFPDTRNKSDNKTIPDPRLYEKNLKSRLSEVSDSDIENDKYKFLFSRINKISIEQGSNPKNYSDTIEKFIKNNNASYSEIYDKLDYFNQNNLMSQKTLSVVTDAINDYTHSKDLEAGDAWPSSVDQEPDDKYNHLTLVREKIIKFSLGPTIRRK